MARTRSKSSSATATPGLELYTRLLMAHTVLQHVSWPPLCPAGLSRHSTRHMTAHSLSSHTSCQLRPPSVTMRLGFKFQAWPSRLTCLTACRCPCPGVDVTLSCLTLEGAALLPPSGHAFGQPAALQLQRAASGMPPLLLQDVNLITDCASVLRHQQYVCQLNTVFLNGTVEVRTPTQRG